MFGSIVVVVVVAIVVDVPCGDVPLPFLEYLSFL